MDKSAAQTPLMKQYLEWKTRYSDSVLFFRLGDFYEMFFDDAVKVSRELDLTLTTRDKNKKDPVPMCGIPHHTKDTYVSRLVGLGYKVTICEQTEEASKAKGIVRREVTQVITPGVILDPEHLDSGRANYLAAVCDTGFRFDKTGGRGSEDNEEKVSAGRSDPAFGLALVDVSTGEFRITAVQDREALMDELARCRPRQVLMPKGCSMEATGRFDRPGSLVEEVPAEWFVGGDKGLEFLAEYAGESVENLKHLDEEAVCTASAALNYLKETFPGVSLPALRVLPYRRSDYMILDEATLTNLEVFETMMEGRREGSLLGTIDETSTAMGSRLFRSILAFPLQDRKEIERRHDAVSQFLDSPGRRGEIRKLLREMHDLERLARRVGHQAATPRDFAALRRSLEKVPELSGLLTEVTKTSLVSSRDISLLDISEDLLQDMCSEVAATIVDEPPAALKDGGVIRPGFNKELDALVCDSKGGRDSILAIEERERKRTGISSLKVKYNRVFGYYIEITRANLADVPDDYTRKQTLVNAERFVTPELAKHEAFVLEAEEKRLELEERLFEDFRGRMALCAGRITQLARKVALVDVLCSFAHVAAMRDFVRPELNETMGLKIKDGIHPVVERHMETGSFVPNDVELDPETQNLLIITGPNMAGKSTIIRQTALIALLAHTGSYVPAAHASIGLVDRIFTRVGASDNLAMGESTFMVEMRETANILRYAGERSLVVLDEIGRGTSTFDGMSLAWATAEYIHDMIRARTLFATHYHELCELARVKKRVKNFAVLVREWNNEIVFLHKLAPGGVNRSYGIQVARLAGLPLQVIKRAGDILGRLERGEALSVWGGKDAQLDLFASEYSMLGPTGRRKEIGPTPPPWKAEIFELIERLDPDKMTPKDALEFLYELRSLVETD